MKRTKYFYYNRNPKGKIIGDCVVRAISTAFDIGYYNVENMLIETSDYFNCDMLVKDCYGLLLEKKFRLPKINGKGRTVEEIVKQFPNSIIILRVNEHLTCAKYGIIYDIWDTRNEIVDIFWVVE